MKNYLIITLGTRDVQLRKDLIEQSGVWRTVAIEGKRELMITNGEAELVVTPNPNEAFPDYYILLPRKMGLSLYRQLPQYRTVVELPLIMPLVNKLQEENKSIDQVLLIYTDQESEHARGVIDGFHYNNDTRYFKDIAKALLQEKFAEAQISEYGITEKVTNIDFQYQHFTRTKHDLLSLPPEQIGEIFLLPQGGIDQINQAITLQLIQAFKHKVRLYQQAEKTDVTELRFTHYFLNDLNKQKIIKHLEDYDFDKALDLYLNNTWERKLCHYAHLRLSLLLDDAIKLGNEFSKKEKQIIGYELVGQISKIPFKLSRIEKLQIKLQDTIILFKVLCIQKKYNEALIKLFTIFENLFKTSIETQLSLNKELGDYYNPEKNVSGQNEKWENLLNSLDKSILPYLKQEDIWIDNPNRKAYFKIFFQLCRIGKVTSILSEKELNNFNTLIEELAGKRNGIAHRLSSVSKTEFDTIIQKLGYTTDSLFDTLDKIASTKELGLFKVIKIKLLEAQGG